VANADTLLAAAMAVAETPVVAPAPAGTPNAPATSAGTFPSERARLEASLQKFLQVADRYPSTTAGAAALYQAANALSALGRVAEAQQRYQDVVNRRGNDIYGQMAQLGLADCYGKAGQLDQAIDLYQKLSTASDTRLPVDGILIQLGRAYRKAGKTDEATRTYTRLVQEFPQSVYVSDAQKALSALKKS
jgi:pentatricopeptide repeat protein